MRKFLKILFILIGTLIGLLVIATLAIRIMFPPAKLRRLVEDQIRTQLHREAQIGNIDLGLSGLTLSRFKLSEVSSFAAGTFLAVDEMKIRWELMPLLSKHVLIRTITLDKPQIDLIRMADGKTLNTSDIAGATASSGKTQQPPASHESTKQPVKSAAGEGWSWRVDQIHLNHGIIRFYDRSPAKQTSVLSDIELVIKDFDPTHVQGRLTVAQLQNPVYQAHDFDIEWALRDIDPSLAHLNGSLKMKQGAGVAQNLTDLVNSSKSAKLALMPLMMLQSLDKLGLVKLGLPNFSHLDIDHIEGDYEFKTGVMGIKKFEIVGPQVTVGATGTVELAPGTLAVDVALHTPKPTLLGEMDLKTHISGTLNNPKTDIESLKKKAFKATVNKVLERPDVQKGINDTLKNLFH